MYDVDLVAVRMCARGIYTWHYRWKLYGAPLVTKFNKILVSKQDTKILLNKWKEPYGTVMGYGWDACHGNFGPVKISVRRCISYAFVLYCLTLSICMYASLFAKPKRSELAHGINLKAMFFLCAWLWKKFLYPQLFHIWHKIIFSFSSEE